jgi:hypothetical protein
MISPVGIKKAQDFYADFISVENFKKLINNPPKKAFPKFFILKAEKLHPLYFYFCN